MERRLRAPFLFVGRAVIGRVRLPERCGNRASFEARRFRGGRLRMAVWVDDISRLWGSPLILCFARSGKPRDRSSPRMGGDGRKVFGLDGDCGGGGRSGTGGSKSRGSTADTSPRPGLADYAQPKGQRATLLAKGLPGDGGYIWGWRGGRIQGMGKLYRSARSAASRSASRLAECEPAGALPSRRRCRSNRRLELS